VHGNCSRHILYCYWSHQRCCDIICVNANPRRQLDILSPYQLESLRSLVNKDLILLERKYNNYDTNPCKSESLLARMRRKVTFTPAQTLYFWESIDVKRIRMLHQSAATTVETVRADKHVWNYSVWNERLAICTSTYETKSRSSSFWAQYWTYHLFLTFISISFQQIYCIYVSRREKTWGLQKKVGEKKREDFKKVSTLLVCKMNTVITCIVVRVHRRIFPRPQRQ